jgi:hypothetical protein
LIQCAAVTHYVCHFASDSVFRFCLPQLTPPFRIDEVTTMIIKTGRIVCHTGAPQWGAGKVQEVTPTLASIDFSDGINRKIAASHYCTLEPASDDSYVPHPDPKPVAKARKAAPRKKK